MIHVSSVGSTAHAVLIRTDECREDIEAAMLRTMEPERDSFLVVPVDDFQCPCAVPDDATLSRWLDSRPDWMAFRAGHE